jgi:nitrous oxide reductase accessory protein NosL
MSPKGDDLIPFQYENDAKNFMKENGGRKILTWKDFKLNLFDLLNL